MKVLIFATAYNGICQRVHKELVQDGHIVDIELSADHDQMFKSYCRFRPSIIVCPFLKHRIPDAIWRAVPCLVMHPGVAGDQGPSSLDWAITNEKPYWGATLLQANDEYDAGAIWDTVNFETRKTSKSSTYRREVTRVGAQMIRNAIRKFDMDNGYNGLSRSELNRIEHEWRPLMKQPDRAIDWQRDSGELIAKKINAADSFPGVLDRIYTTPVYLYGARYEARSDIEAEPGMIVGHKDEAIARACKGGVVWIRQLRKSSPDHKLTDPDNPYFKLPALRALNTQIAKGSQLSPLDSDIQGDIRVEIKNETAYLYFDFYNGAFSTEQCQQLLCEFKLLESRQDIKVITLMGGQDFFSNGIHLNCIEAADNPALESMRNIEAIDDLVEAIITCQSKLTVAALRSNAGAGGAILPLACDYVIAREGVVLNPHYKTMGLTGSEFWTYLLPKRVGKKKAYALTEECLPLLATQALEINLVDEVFCEDWESYHQHLFDYCAKLTSSSQYKQLLKAKTTLRKEDEKAKPLLSYRTEELREMKAIFNNPDSSYHKRRSNFVHKYSCGKTPERLRARQEFSEPRETSAVGTVA
ncbi:enoyl-CoA hydratase-related protein [Aliikangiella sp. G2MR2-5]|uniref:enoyl-CoA hydratase-related protein n=1 Tax=Aliikangiella sp. G2MR2-5 TaxID=2788943 RepID=UPI0018AC1807|nr:enoyl-CoA hydratase-related protein [Aliikangiella sp. G2MR2-5]